MFALFFRRFFSPEILTQKKTASCRDASFPAALPKVKEKQKM